MHDVRKSQHPVAANRLQRVRAQKACWVGFAGICQLEAPLSFRSCFFLFLFAFILVFSFVLPGQVRCIIKPEPRFEPPRVRQFHVTATAPRPRRWQNPQPDTSPPTSAALFCFPTLFPLVFIAFASLSFACLYSLFDIRSRPSVRPRDESRRGLFLQLATCGGGVANSAIGYPFGISPFLPASQYHRFSAPTTYTTAPCQLDQACARHRPGPTPRPLSAV